MIKSTTLLEGDLTLYARLFYYSRLQENDKRIIDGVSFPIFAHRHHNSIKEFLPALNEVVADEELNKLVASIKERLKICLDILNLYMLCSYVNEVIRDQYIVLLKKPTKEALEELGELEEITFRDKNGKTVSTGYNELLRVCIDSAKEYLSLKGEVIETAKVGRYDKIGSTVEKSIIQSQFANYLARFLAEVFPDADRSHRGEQTIISPLEQELILRLMGYFGLSLKGENLKTENFRKLITNAYEKMHYPFDAFVLTIKYDDWQKKINWKTPELKLKQLTEEEEDWIFLNPSSIIKD